MVFLFGKEYSNSLSIEKVLNSVFGIRYSYSRYLIRRLGFRSTTALGLLSPIQIKFLLRRSMKNRFLLSSLSSSFNEHKKKKIRLRTYQGLRLVQGLPANGQRSRSNARTCRRLKWSN